MFYISEDCPFAALQTIEFSSFVKQGVVSIVSSSSVDFHRIIGARVVDFFNRKRTTDDFEKSWLVIHAFNKNSPGVNTQAPTFQQSSIRFLVGHRKLKNDLELFTRNIFQE